MSRTRLLLPQAALLVLSACEPAPLPARLPPARAIPVVASAVASSSSAPPPAEPAVACSLHTSDPDWWTPLYLAPDLPQYATAHGRRDVSAVMRVGPASLGARVVVRAQGWELAGVAPSSALTLHVTRPILLSGVVIPSADAPLAFTRGEPGALVVGTSFEPGLVVHEGDAPVACADLTLGRSGTFDAITAIGGFGLDRSMRLAGDGPVPLAKTPGGPPAATMTGADIRNVHVIAEEGAQARIAWSLYGTYLVGWVPSARLEPVAPFVDHGRGTGGGFGHSAHNVHACTADVPLFVAFQPNDALRARFPRIDDAPHPVGTLRAGGQLSRGEAAGAYVEIDLGVADVSSTHSRFLVRAADLGSCAPLRRSSTTAAPVGAAPSSAPSPPSKAP